MCMLLVMSGLTRRESGLESVRSQTLCGFGDTPVEEADAALRNSSETEV